MKRYQSLLLQRLDISVPGLCVHRLALHRHLPETTSVRPHSHRYAQCLLYLSGQGRQQVGDRLFPVRSGTAVFLPPRIRHAFIRGANRRPICLVVDLEWRGASRRPAVVRPLPALVLRELQREVSVIAHLQRQSRSGPALQMSAAILRLLDQLLAGLGMTRGAPHEPSSPVSLKLARLLDSPASANLPLGKLAQLAGYQRDHLNRLLKRQTGLTLGQVRARKLVATAQALLRESRTVADVAGAVGFTDANYFTRWFRKQTGLTPTHWRRGMIRSL